MFFVYFIEAWIVLSLVAALFWATIGLLTRDLRDEDDE